MLLKEKINFVTNKILTHNEIFMHRKLSKAPVGLAKN